MNGPRSDFPPESRSSPCISSRPMIAGATRANPHPSPDAGGFEKASIYPRLDLGDDGQVAEGHAPDESRLLRDTYQDMTAFTGFTTVHARGGWTVQTQLNATSVITGRRRQVCGKGGGEP